MELPQVDAVMKSTVSVRDKLKKRREALGSILSGIGPSTEPKINPDAAKKESETSSQLNQGASNLKVDKTDSSDEQPSEKKLKMSSTSQRLKLGFLLQLQCVTLNWSPDNSLIKLVIRIPDPSNYGTIPIADKLLYGIWIVINRQKVNYLNAGSKHVQISVFKPSMDESR